MKSSVLAATCDPAIVLVCAAFSAKPKDPHDDALRAAAAYVRDNSAPNEPILAGEVRNRYALLNPLIAYYLADRPPGVRDTMYNPGVSTTEATQRRMVGDLRTNDVRLLLLGRDLGRALRDIESQS